MLNKYHHNHVDGRGNNRIGAIFLALMPMLLAGCGHPLEAATPGATGNVTTQEVANKTNQLIGKTVTIRSEPVRKIGVHSFTVRDKQLFGNETILVVNATGKPLVLPTNNIQVQATGKVAKFVVADINRVYGLDLQPSLYVAYEGKPAIIAQSMALAPKPGTVTKNPSLFYGKTLAVPGEVANIVGFNAFTLEENKLFGGNNLLVLNVTPKNTQKTINQGEKVVVTGVLRKFVIADIERDYDLTWDLNLQRKLEVEYKNKPVLITNSVFPSAQ